MREQINTGRWVASNQAETFNNHHDTSDRNGQRKAQYGCFWISFTIHFYNYFGDPICCYLLLRVRVLLTIGVWGLFKRFLRFESLLKTKLTSYDSGAPYLYLWLAKNWPTSAHECSKKHLPKDGINNRVKCHILTTHTGFNTLMIFGEPQPPHTITLVERYITQTTSHYFLVSWIDYSIYGFLRPFSNLNLFKPLETFEFISPCCFAYVG